MSPCFFFFFFLPQQESFWLHVAAVSGSCIIQRGAPQLPGFVFPPWLHLQRAASLTAAISSSSACCFLKQLRRPKWPWTRATPEITLLKRRRLQDPEMFDEMFKPAVLGFS